MYNGSTYSTTPNSPNINFAKKLPTTPHQPKLLIKKNVQTARQINRWISFFRACSCASCAFVFLPPVREADACLDDCEDLAFCGDLAVDVERLAVVLLLVFDCEPLLYVLLFPVATVCTPSLFPHSPIMTDIFLNVITHMAVRIHIQTATRVYLCQFKCSYCSILLFFFAFIKSYKQFIAVWMPPTRSMIPTSTACLPTNTEPMSFVSSFVLNMISLSSSS